MRLTICLPFAALLLLSSGAGAAVTLEQIMADPDWIGNAPEGAYWSDDGQAVLYRQKRTGESFDDHYRVPASGGTAERVDPATGVTGSNASRRFNAARTAVVWVADGDVFERRWPDGPVRQLTRTAMAETDAQFVSGRNAISYRQGEQHLVHELDTGLVRQLVDLRFEDDPDAEPEFDSLREHQQRTYTTIVEDARREEASAEHERAAQRASPNGAPLPTYLGKEYSEVARALSPDATKMVLITRSADYDEGQAGVMPNYMTASGYTETRELRVRVGRNAPAPHRAWLIDIAAQSVTPLSFADLSGIDSDPLKALRRSAIAWHTERGADRETIEAAVEAPDERPLQVEGMEWSPDGRHVALQLHAIDNKDRWLVTVNADAEVALQHRLTDPAWINYFHNEFGWLPDSAGLWLLSEESGYSHLYVKRLNQRRARALTRGEHVVSDVVLSADGRFLYYRANSAHPSTYEIHRVAVAGGDAEVLTAMGGVNTFVLSPDERRLLVRHSTFDRHPDLFVVKIGDNSEAVRLTDTVSDAYKAISWSIPEIVEVPSSHVERSIYSKLYLPADYDPSRSYPAVMFVHGAGYTQNAHAGWPYYFREFMFHTLLNQRGVIVIDMDYRASKGYGRDWRTAIYRNMGRPELEDFKDGVDWLVENYNVDRARVGIYGGSYGGFMTFMAMFLEPQLFAAGAGLRPVTDWVHYNHEYTSNILNTPLIDPEAFHISSPIQYADGLENPLLIAAGMQDDNVFFQDSVLLVQRLIELRKQDFELAVYPLDPHGFVHADSWLDEYRRVLKLFERHVIGE